MDEKRLLDDHTMPSPSRFRRTRALAFVSLLAVLGIYTFSNWLPVVSRPLNLDLNVPLQGGRDSVDGAGVSEQDLIPLEAHVMSKCPDTRDAMRKLILPAMQKVSDKVDFKLTFIGTPTGDEGVECKHGPSECLGNIIELCARELYPDPKLSLGFVMCLVKDYKHIPERSLVEDCALEHAIDFQALNECATRDDGAHGMKMLRDSVERSKEVSDVARTWSLGDSYDSLTK